MGWLQFERLIREENVTPAALRAAMDGNVNTPEAALRVAMFMLFDKRDQVGLDHLAGWVWKLVERAASLPDGGQSEGEDGQLWQI